MTMPERPEDRKDASREVFRQAPQEVYETGTFTLTMDTPTWEAVSRTLVEFCEHNCSDACGDKTEHADRIRQLRSCEDIALSGSERAATERVLRDGLSMYLEKVVRAGEQHSVKGFARFLLEKVRDAE